MDIHERDVRFYETFEGRSPFQDWIDGLKDERAIEIITIRIGRLRAGSFGDCRPVGGGVLELRVHYGPGYRIYLGPAGSALVILLCGGDKSTQAKDIRMAQRYWEDYRRQS